MSDTAYDAAVNMLVDDPVIPGPESTVVPETNESVEAPTPEITPEVVTEESFANIDPTTLPPELLAVYKQMQGDYTRKTQEIAAYRNLGTDPDTLQRAYDFYSRMDTDAEFAKQVAQYVLQQTDGVTDEPVVEEADDFSFDDNVPAALQREIESLRQWREQMEQERVMDQMQRLVLKQETDLRQANPHYEQDDIDAIYEIAASMEVPDLIQAEERYTNLQALWARRLLANKSPGSAPTPVAPGSFSQEPVRPKSLDEATAIGLDMILGQNGQ